jgi:CHAT domain-containing protein
MKFSSFLFLASLLALIPLTHDARSAPRDTTDYLSLLAQADSLRRDGTYDRAVQLAKQALAITEREFGKADTSVARALHILGDCARREDRLEDAEQLLNRSLTIREQKLGPDDPWVARSLNSLALLEGDLGHNEQSMALHLRALEIRRHAFGEIHPEVAISLGNLAGLYLRESMIEAADSLYNLAFDVHEHCPEPDYQNFARTVNNLATIYDDEGRYDDAEALHKRALALRERKQGRNHPDVAESLVNLAILEEERARYADAEQLLQRAAKIYERAGGDYDLQMAATLANLGKLYVDQGRCAEAEPVLKRASGIYEHAAGDVKFKLANVLNNMATALQNQGQLAEAEPVYRRVVSIFEDAAADSNADLASALDNLAVLLGNQRRYAAAESLHVRAIGIWKYALGEHHPEVAAGLLELGVAYDDAGRYDDGWSVLTQALAIREEVFGEHHPDVAATLSVMGTHAILQGRYTDAQQYESRAWEIRRENFRDGAAVLAERSALDYSTFLSEESDNYLSLLLDAPDGAVTNAKQIVRVVLAAKGVVSDGLAARQHVVITEDDPAVRELADQLRQARFALSALYVHGPDDDNLEGYRDELQAAIADKAEIEADLARKSARFARELKQASPAVSDIAANLPPGSAAVEFMRYEHRQSLRDTETRYLALVVRSDGIASVYPLGSAATIDTAVVWYRRHFNNPRSITMESYRTLAGNLYALVWRPLAASLYDAQSVFVAPDGDLNLVSFAGLLDDAGHYLIEKYPVHYLSTARDLIRLQDVPAPGNGLLAMGDPDYDLAEEVAPQFPDSAFNDASSAVIENVWTRGGCTELRDLTVSRLPGTATEVQTVAAEWQQHSGERVTTLLGRDATEEHFKSDCEAQRVIHLATHGFFLSDACRRSQSSTGEHLAIDSPLLLSGLLFAGANRHAQTSGGEDGVVTAEEIAGMNFAGTELVVLSACETGLGEVRNGEGVYGLRRAFQIAGARTVISALWSVDDRSTADLMKQLFAAHGVDLPTAMRDAALKRIADARANHKSDHPFLWAGFIATGDWRTP